MSCKSTRDTSIFISLASLKTNNAEFNEYLVEKIESFVIRRPECFLDSLLNLDDKSIIEIVNILHHPSFMDEDKIAEVFSNNKQNKKYDKVMKIYFKE